MNLRKMLYQKNPNIIKFKLDTQKHEKFNITIYTVNLETFIVSWTNKENQECETTRYKLKDIQEFFDKGSWIKI